MWSRYTGYTTKSVHFFSNKRRTTILCTSSCYCISPARNIWRLRRLRVLRDTRRGQIDWRLVHGPRSPPGSSQMCACIWTCDTDHLREILPGCATKIRLLPRFRLWNSRSLLLKDKLVYFVHSSDSQLNCVRDIALNLCIEFSLISTTVCTADAAAVRLPCSVTVGAFTPIHRHLGRKTI
jgi:hypothetical protein